MLVKEGVEQRQLSPLPSAGVTLLTVTDLLVKEGVEQRQLSPLPSAGVTLLTVTDLLVKEGVEQRQWNEHEENTQNGLHLGTERRLQHRHNSASYPQQDGK